MNWGLERVEVGMWGIVIDCIIGNSRDGDYDVFGDKSIRCLVGLLFV